MLSSCVVQIIQTIVFVYECVRVEDSDGVGDPRDTEQLSLNRECSTSKLMLGLWASAILLGTSG